MELYESIFFNNLYYSEYFSTQNIFCLHFSALSFPDYLGSGYTKCFFKWKTGAQIQQPFINFKEI